METNRTLVISASAQQDSVPITGSTSTALKRRAPKSAAEISEEEETLKKGLRNLTLTNSTYVFSAARYIIVVLSFMVIQRDGSNVLIGDNTALWTTISLVGLFFLPTAAEADRQVDEALNDIDEYSRNSNGSLLSESFGVAKLYVETVFARAATASTISAFVIGLFALMMYATADTGLVFSWAYALSVFIAVAYAIHYFAFKGVFLKLLDCAAAHHRGELAAFCQAIGLDIRRATNVMNNFARWEKSMSDDGDTAVLVDAEWAFLFGLRLTLFYARVLDALSSLGDFFFVISFQPAASVAASNNLVGQRYAVTFQVFFYLGIILTGLWPLGKLCMLIHQRYKSHPPRRIHCE